jgi:hypothetical protein
VGSDLFSEITRDIRSLKFSKKKPLSKPCGNQEDLDKFHAQLDVFVVGVLNPLQQLVPV